MDRITPFAHEPAHVQGYATIDDAQLLDRARRDIDAFAELYHRYANRVYRYLLTSVSDADTAADLTQQVFVQSFQAIADYQDRGLPVAAWLFRIARNAAIDSIRRRRRLAPWACHEENPDSSRNPEAEVLHRERIGNLHAAVTRLAPSKQELLALRFGGELSMAEIAAVVGKREAAVQK